jgi:hypothetical protein
MKLTRRTTRSPSTTEEGKAYATRADTYGQDWRDGLAGLGECCASGAGADIVQFCFEFSSSVRFEFSSGACLEFSRGVTIGVRPS